mmetsp:Transcript_10342/g.22813  ORF Transcript_10342/g.22813 Transcript_10342/m.22813 type:complete len:89 (-) Transcript_10342:201-467(-)|eukprot:CAMPEP_0206506814 /NCGR_PEP_ID=MMETSP0324_2-20121206/57068_1 /ASSEMBLY_ACC=CAM_ASM_000836 /TAXON_ID=2866 /ORGANISM="Crypthecodinium cohnii, Strain Seligo" /LENGTH=88 /DNA_ID=CAMNT_0053996773 /DNA_START=44 /DNA_END=310 /DNA_ORIENTATION=+
MPHRTNFSAGLQTIGDHAPPDSPRECDYEFRDTKSGPSVDDGEIRNSTASLAYVERKVVSPNMMPVGCHGVHSKHYRMGLNQLRMSSK